mgnify:CR=1 FL=1
MIYENILNALSFLEEHKDVSPDMLRRDRELLGSILWYLYVAIQGAIDLGLKVISRLKLETPESYIDVFRILRDAGIIPENLAQELIRMAKFRHILAHIYFKLDYSMICEIIRGRLTDIRRYLDIIANTLGEKGIQIDEL